MAAPATSNWMSSAPLSAWVLHGQNVVCATTGWDFLQSLQTFLQSRLADQELPSFDGANVGPDAVPINDPTLPSRGWDRDLLRALWAVARRDGAPSSYLSAITDDAQAGTMSARTLAVAAWVSYFGQGIGAQTGQQRYGVGSPDEVSIPADIVLPSAVQAPPPSVGAGSGTASTGFACNTIPASTASLIPISRTVSPFSFNTLLVFGIIALGVGAAVLFTNRVPNARTRRNPRGRRRARASDRARWRYR